MNQKQKFALEKIRKVIADETDPKKLTKQEYLEVIEEVASDLDGAIDAVRAELEAEE